MSRGFKALQHSLSMSLQVARSCRRSSLGNIISKSLIISRGKTSKEIPSPSAVNGRFESSLFVTDRLDRLFISEIEQSSTKEAHGEKVKCECKSRPHVWFCRNANTNRRPHVVFCRQCTQGTQNSCVSERMQQSISQSISQSKLLGHWKTILHPTPFHLRSTRELKRPRWYKIDATVIE
jgi:hypothetical protein